MTKSLTFQEVFEDDFEDLAKYFNMDGLFVPVDQHKVELRPGMGTGYRGVSILTNLPFDNEEGICYKGDGIVPIYTHPENNESWLGLMTAYEDGIPLRIETTHFTYSYDAKATELQRRSFQNLMSALEGEENLMLSGDFNAPRGKEIFNRFLEYFEDNLPADIDSTLDPNLHRAKGLKLVVDTLFTRGSISVTDVQAHQGISDHMGLSGLVSNSTYAN